MNLLVDPAEDLHVFIHLFVRTEGVCIWPCELVMQVLVPNIRRINFGEYGRECHVMSRIQTNTIKMSCIQKSVYNVWRTGRSSFGSSSVGGNT